MKHTLTAVASRGFRGDRIIWSIFVLLAVASVLAVYSSTGRLAYKIHGGDTEHLLVRHFITLALGAGALYLAYLTPYRRFRQLAPGLLLLAVAGLVVTALFGIEINDARRWIEVPFTSVRFQPSDFAKIALVLYLARALSGIQDRIAEGGPVFWRVVFPVLVVCGLIAPSDLSTAVMLGLTSFAIMFIARLPMRYIAMFFAGLLALGALMYVVWTVAPETVRFGTWFSRVAEFQRGEGGYQVDQAKIAIANGHLFGVGPGQSVQRNYLPTPYADFIYAIVCEEYGLLGAALVIALYLMLFIRTCRLLTRSTKLFGALLACGLSLLLVLQALANIAVSVNLVPVTGLTLPIVSLGGTSLVFSCLAVGMILSVSRFTESESDGRLKRGRRDPGPKSAPDRDGGLAIEPA